MAASRDIVARLKLLGQREFVTGMGQATAATGKLGKQTEKTGKQSESSAKGLLKWTAASYGLYKAYGYLKDSVNSTTALAKNTAALQRVTGMDATTASSWVQTAKERNVSAMTLNRAFTILGKNIDTVSKGASGATAAFSKLGLSQAQLSGMTAEQRIRAVSDALAALPDPMERAALGQKLMGRGYLQLLPILAGGTKQIKEQERAMKDAHATLNEAGVKDGKKMAETQRALNRELEGVQITIAQALMPVLKMLADDLVRVMDRARPVLDVMKRNGSTIATVAFALAGLIGAIKTYNLLMKTVEMVTGLVTAAQWLWNIALDANPIGAVVIAIAALVGALVLLYEKNRTFRNAVKATWQWIKDHWQELASILLAPFAPLFLAFKALRHPLGFFKSLVPGLAEGGTITRAGQVLVGERGPELLTLPAGASVTPRVTPAMVAQGPSGGSPQTVITKVYLDKRQIAQAVADVTADRRARK